MTNSLRDVPAWGISLVVNLSILAAFHFVVYEKSNNRDVTTITSISDDTIQEEMNFSEATISDQSGDDGDSFSPAQSLNAATELGTNDTPPQEKVEEFLNPEMPQLSETSMVKLEGDLATAVEVKGTSEHSTERGVEGAMDRVAFEIQTSLKERKTLVVWLFDASGSLEERREAVANRFDNIYKQLGKSGTTDGLYSVVVTYGKGVKLLTPQPIQDVEELSKIVREDIENDTSGKENVFGAAKVALEKFRTWKRFDGPWNKLGFIVTDERGDDIQYLEDTISLAKRSQMRFYTIGNAAIFGQLKGYYRYTYEDGYEEDIPVDQGPESAFPDGVQLPFIGGGRDWKLRQMSASYGPYGLTRLCAETGGLYIITEESRGYKFDQSIMRRYAPDYRPLRTQDTEIRKNAAKSALRTVAGMTYEDSLPVPELTFRAYNDNLLRTEIGVAQRPVAEIDYKLKRLFEQLALGERGREDIREPRWQAAFDLAMGRLLAMRVRYAGYNKMLANMKVNPKSFKGEKNNMWRLTPSSTIDSGPEMRKAAASAKEYLKRVIDDHPGTPWAMLAERELSAELGWAWTEFSQPIPGSNGMTRANDEQVRLLLANEDDERQKMAAKKAKPRRRPNL